ncbi:MAG: hypothetical protein E6H54_09855 [Betaproteobacteria bacterium]|nr:MAG: hypothetical protein E6H54_09855 [Betaproteobacteria bacterium]
MATDLLTAKQRRLVHEIEQIAETFSLDYQDIRRYEREARTPVLEIMKNKLVRGQVILWYTLLDEFLNNKICEYYFGRKRGFPKLWKTKPFQRFNHYILEELYPLQKLRLVSAIRKVPKTFRRDIEALNALRNGLAHAFFPENLRKSKPQWKGHDIFSLKGAQEFQTDMYSLSDYFFGLKPELDGDVTSNPTFERDARKNGARPSP